MSKKHKGHHTGKARPGMDMHLKSIAGDKMAHSSHHDNHGEGDQKGMHGFGPNFAPPEGYQGDSDGEGVHCQD